MSYQRLFGRQDYLRYLRGRNQGLFVPMKPFVVTHPSPKTQSLREFLGGIGKSALANAVVYGLSAVVPPFGAVAIPAYAAYNYSALGYGLYKIYSELRSKELSTAGQAAEAIAKFAAQPAADQVANELTFRAQQAGLFEKMANATGIESVVFAEMIRGSTSSAMSSGAGELTSFAIKSVTGS